MQSVDVDSRARRYVEEVDERGHPGEEDGEEELNAGQLEDDSDRIRFLKDNCGCNMKFEERLKSREESIFIHILNIREWIGQTRTCIL